MRWRCHIRRHRHLRLRCCGRSARGGDGRLAGHLPTLEAPACRPDRELAVGLSVGTRTPSVGVASPEKRPETGERTSIACWERCLAPSHFIGHRN